MAASFTPGPWVVLRNHADRVYGIGPAAGYYDLPGGGQTDVIAPFTMPGEQNKHNAYLAAAAPELLALVEEYRKVAVYYIARDEKNGDHEGASRKRLTLDVIDDVLAKARGEQP